MHQQSGLPNDPQSVPADAGPLASALIGRLQAELAEATTAGAAKSGLLASVSHEIRNHLAAVLGMTQSVLETRITPQQRDYLEVVMSTGDTLVTLVNDLLDVSRLEAGRLRLQETPFRLRDALGDVMASFLPTATAKGVALTLEVDPDVPVWLVCDPGRFRQIVVNLVGNALKFTDAGRVTVGVGAEPGGERTWLVHVTVEDTGPGIAPDQLGAIFEPYVQVGKGEARGGTGLGLSIVASLLEAMDGRMFVESDVGTGSRFGASVPMGAYDESHTMGRRPIAGEFDGLPVLVVADVRDQRIAVASVLQAAGFEPETADDEDAALARLLESVTTDRQFAVTLCDLRTGSFNVAERVREQRALDAMHLIVVAQVGQRGDAARCRDLKAAGYLVHPVPPSDALGAIKAVLAGPSPMDLAALVTRHWLRERRQHLHLLVADDSPTNRVVARRLLETRGHTVTLASSGHEAVAQAAEHRFDLIFMDLDMPGLDGPQNPKTPFLEFQ